MRKDEIGVINMAIGAAHGGVSALVLRGAEDEATPVAARSF